MLRLALLALYLAASLSFGLNAQPLSAATGDLTANLDPNGSQAPPPEEISGAWDPNGAQAPETGDVRGNLDPNG
jgi:hypothetical protein